MIRSVASHFSSIVVALLFAVIVWAVATAEENPSREAFYTEPLPIEITNRAEGLVVYQQTEEAVRIQVRAPQASWDQLRPASFRAEVDLQSFDVGMHQVPVKVQVTDPRVTVTRIEPDAVGIRLERVKTREFEVQSDVLDTVSLGYTFRPPTVSPARVTVSGPGVLVDRVTEVAADVYLRGAKAPFEREVTVLARDAQENSVRGVTITPATVMVKVHVEQRVGYKDVSIKAVLKGAVAPGYWVSNIVVSPSTAMIVGGPDLLTKIPGFIETAPIDVSGATVDLTKRAALSLPEGVSVVNNEGVTVQVAVTPIMGGQTVRRKVILQGLARGLLATISPDSVEVILSGPLTTLQDLAPDDVQVVLDATGLTPGTYALKPRVPVVPNTLRAQNIVPETVQVIVIEPTPTPTPTFTPTPRPTPILTPRSTVTLTLTVTPRASPTSTPIPTR